MAQTTFRVIVAETSTAIDAHRVSRRMAYRPTSRRQDRWKKARTELPKEAVWLAIVQRHVLLQHVGHRSHPERVRRAQSASPAACMRLHICFIISRSEIPIQQWP